MYYTIISKKPFIYLQGNNSEILQSDYEFVTENISEFDIVDITGFSDSLKFEEFSCRSPSAFSRLLDSEVEEGLVYTFKDGELIAKVYKKAPYFYVSLEDGIDYFTYCSNPNTIKSGLLQNEELIPVVGSLFSDYMPPEDTEISLESPSDTDNVIAYVCIPVRMKIIPIGTETEEEHLEIQEDSEF